MASQLTLGHSVTCRVKQDLYATMNSKQAALQLLQDREQQLSALSATANTFKQQLEDLQRSVDKKPWLLRVCAALHQVPCSTRACTRHY